MNEGPQKPEGRLDNDEALESAYAEKPYRDALADYKSGLSEAGKRALEWIASREAEKALEKYRSAQKEDPAMRILRQRALATLELPESVRRTVAQKERVAQRGRGEGIYNSWANRCKYGLQEFGKELIEKLLGDQQMEAVRKGAELKRLGFDLGTGVEHYIEGKIAPDITLRPENILWGYIIASMMDIINPETKIDTALGKISVKAKMPEKLLIQKHFGFFERARISYPEIGKNLDRVMEKYRWLWDETQKKYISIK